MRVAFNPGHYILVGHTPVLFQGDVLAWAEWFETANRTVAQTEIGATWVSTVFLGLDHAFGGPPPMLFETMIFTDGDPEDFQRRCSTWDQAEAQHAAAVAEVKARTA
jgi:hypothetical protein